MIIFVANIIMIMKNKINFNQKVICIIIKMV